MEKSRLFIVGAPKCGTTSLAHWLAEHPQIHMSSIKEPHYYNTDMNYRVIKNASEYEALFTIAPSETRVLAEASTWYLYSGDAVPNILAEHPDAKFIVMTRDPVEMAVSLFHHNRFKMHEDRETLEEAWSLQGRRASGEALPKDCKEPAFLQYRAACSLGSLLSRLYARVPPRQTLHLRLEGIRKEPRRVYQEILDFLDIQDDGRTAFPVYNEAREARSRAIGRLMKIGISLKSRLGIERKIGLTKLNSRRLSTKQVSETQLTLMRGTLLEQCNMLDAALSCSSLAERRLVA